MIKNISSSELFAYMNREDYQIIDLRKLERYQEEHILGAVHINAEDILAGNVLAIKKQKVILYCERGGSSMRVANYLDKKGYEVWNVIGGYRQIKNSKSFVTVQS